MENLTIEISENVDNIVISKEFLRSKKTKIEVFNQDKKLSDHIWICITIIKEQGKIAGYSSAKSLYVTFCITS